MPCNSNDKVYGRVTQSKYGNDVSKIQASGQYVFPLKERSHAPNGPQSLKENSGVPLDGSHGQDPSPLGQSPHIAKDLEMIEHESLYIQEFLSDDFASLFSGPLFFSREVRDTIKTHVSNLIFSGTSQSVRHVIFAYMSFCKAKDIIATMEYLNKCYAYLRQDISTVSVHNLAYTCSLLSQVSTCIAISTDANCSHLVGFCRVLRKLRTQIFALDTVEWQWMQEALTHCLRIIWLRVVSPPATQYGQLIDVTEFEARFLQLGPELDPDESIFPNDNLTPPEGDLWNRLSLDALVVSVYYNLTYFLLQRNGLINNIGDESSTLHALLKGLRQMTTLIPKLNQDFLNDIQMLSQSRLDEFAEPLISNSHRYVHGSYFNILALYFIADLLDLLISAEFGNPPSAAMNSAISLCRIYETRKSAEPESVDDNLKDLFFAGLILNDICHPIGIAIINYAADN